MRSVVLYGYQVVILEYFYKVIVKFQNILNIIYIVCFLEICWVQEYLWNFINVFYSDLKYGVYKDMVLLVVCDYVIIIVGIFGWWGGWLFGGNVIYFKWFVK